MKNGFSYLRCIHHYSSYSIHTTQLLFIHVEWSHFSTLNQCIFGHMYRWFSNARRTTTLKSDWRIVELIWKPYFENSIYDALLLSFANVFPIHLDHSFLTSIQIWNIIKNDSTHQWRPLIILIIRMLQMLQFCIMPCHSRVLPKISADLFWFLFSVHSPPKKKTVQ